MSQCLSMDVQDQTVAGSIETTQCNVWLSSDIAHNLTTPECLHPHKVAQRLRLPTHNSCMGRTCLPSSLHSPTARTAPLCSLARAQRCGVPSRSLSTRQFGSVLSSLLGLGTVSLHIYSKQQKAYRSSCKQSESVNRDVVCYKTTYSHPLTETFLVL